MFHMPIVFSAYTNIFSNSVLVITSTDYGPEGANGEVPDQNEYVTITQISGNSVTISPPLTYMHWGQDFERAEVGLLTRNIVIQGDNDSLIDGFGGHVIIRAVYAAHIEGVEFTT